MLYLTIYSTRTSTISFTLGPTTNTPLKLVLEEDDRSVEPLISVQVGDAVSEDVVLGCHRGRRVLGPMHLVEGKTVVYVVDMRKVSQRRLRSS